MIPSFYNTTIFVYRYREMKSDPERSTSPASDFASGVNDSDQDESSDDEVDGQANGTNGTTHNGANGTEKEADETQGASSETEV